MVRAVWASLATAAIVQVVAVSVVLVMPRERLYLAWSIGAALRLATVVLYALLVVPAFALPAAPALLSLVAMLFVTTLLEPLLLAKKRK